VLSSLGFHDYFGLGVIVISVPAQAELAYVGDELYTRSRDDTVAVSDARAIAGLVSRFSG
jgi:hypothetical protein